MRELGTDLRRPSRNVECLFELDSPDPEQTMPGDVVLVSGWALLDGHAPSLVEVFVAGCATARARIRLPRSDVAAELPDYPEGGVSGFEARVPVELLPGERRGLSVQIRLRSHESGEWTSPVRHFILDNPAPQPDDTEIAENLRRQTSRMLARVGWPTRDPKHVLIFTHSLALGGGQLWLHELLDGLVRRHGWRATIVTQMDGALRPECDELGVPIHLTSPYRVRDVAGYQGHVTELAQLALATGAGVALVNTLGAFLAVDAVKQAGLPCAWVVHESFHLSDFAYQNWGPAGLPATVRHRWSSAIAGTDRMLFVADATREMFQPLAETSHCQTIRYGTPMVSHGGATTTKERTAARRLLGIPDETTLIFNIGVLEPRKGQGQLIAAMDRVRSTRPDALLHIVGNHPSPYARALTEFTRRSGLSDWVNLVPLQRDPTPWFHAADLFVNSSDVESLPRSILESICCGLPVLASDVFGAREMIRDGHSGWLFEPNDVDALTVGLLRALDTPDERRHEMAGCAFADIREWLDPRHYTARYSEVLDELALGAQ